MEASGKLPMSFKEAVLSSCVTSRRSHLHSLGKVWLGIWEGLNGVAFRKIKGFVSFSLTPVYSSFCPKSSIGQVCEAV